METFRIRGSAVTEALSTSELVVSPPATLWWHSRSLRFLPNDIATIAGCGGSPTLVQVPSPSQGLRSRHTFLQMCLPGQSSDIYDGSLCRPVPLGQTPALCCLRPAFAPERG